MQKDRSFIADAAGTLPEKVFRAKIAAGIAAEYDKAAPDPAYLNACEDCLMAYDGRVLPQIDEEQHRQLLLQRCAQWRRKVKARKRVLTTAAAAAALFVLLIVTDSTLHWSGVIERSVNHEQQYRIGSMEIDPGLVAYGNADGSMPVSRITTDDFDEAVGVLGFTPGMPEIAQDGWQAASYIVEHATESASMITFYQRGDEQMLYYVAGFDEFVDRDTRIAASLTGDKRTVDGVNYWIKESEEQASCLWLGEHAVYQLTAMLSPDVLLTLAQTVVPGEETQGCTGDAQINTTDWDKVISVLGFTPSMPTYIPEGVDLSGYYVSASSFSQSFRASYTVPRTDESFNYIIDCYDNAEEAADGLNYEQNCEGRTVTEQGVSYYIAYNYERPRVVWSEGLTSYCLSGMMAEEELLRMAVSVSGGDPMRIALGTVKHPVALVTDEEAVSIAKADLEAKYDTTLSDMIVSVAHARMSETKSEIMVEFRQDKKHMWQYAARVDAQTGDVIASIDDVSWEPYSGALLQPIGYGTD